MSIASVSHGLVFGINNNIKDNVFYLEESTILYPAGSNIVLYDTETHVQKFIPVPEHGEGITALAVSADRMTMALAEASINKPSISIFELNSHRKRKTLYLENSSAREFLSISISLDSKYIAALSGAPDYLLSYYAWEKGKSIATINVAPNGYTGKLRQVSINPNDATEICVIGETIFKVYRYAEGVLRPIRFNLPNRDYKVHTWIASSCIALGTAEGHIYIAHEGNLLQEIRFEQSIECIVPLPKGFLVGGQQGLIAIYDQLNADARKENYTLRRKFILPDSEICVQTLVTSTSFDDLLVRTAKNQIFKVSLAPTESDKKEDEDAKMSPVTNNFHYGAIKGMDTCGRKPLLVTCGSDKSIRLWNYLSGHCEQVKYFPEEAYSISLHPSGLYILAGFSDKLRLMTVLMDDMRTYREFPIRSCQECRFSNGGHLFAATHGNMIQIHSVWTFETIALLKGHNGKVRSLYFTPDDSILVSAGSDGAVYTWNMKDFKRENEHILKTCSYSSAVCSPNGKTVFAVGIDRTLKEITESSVTREMDNGTILTQVVVSHSGRMMFVGTSTGSIRSIKFPLSENNEFQEHEAHASAVTKLRISFDDQYLFSCSEDGSVYVFKVADKDEHTLKREKAVIFSDEILITKSDLEEKTVLMAELQRSLEELKLEHEYQLRLKDMNFNEKLKDITDKYSQEIEALKISTSVLRTEKDKEDIKHQEEIRNLKSKQVQEIHEVEAKYNQELMEEYEKFQKAQEKANETQQSWQQQMRRFEEETQLELTENQSSAEAHLNTKAFEISKLRDQSLEQTKELDEMMRQNDEDIDTEVQQLILRYEKKVKSEREDGARLKGENGIMKKKFNTLNKDIEENKAEIQRMAENEKKLQSVIATFEKEIVQLKKEMAERDERIQDKERKVYDLKKRNQELEKFKFVLDFRIKELKEQVEPRENQIADMTADIKDINEELEALAKKKKTLEDSIESLKSSLVAKKQTYQREHNKVIDLNRQIKDFKTDLQDTVTYFQDPPVLKKMMENLQRKFCSRRGQSAGPAKSVESSLKAEYLQQQQELRKQIAKLRGETNKDDSVFRFQNVQAVAENRQLIREIGALRSFVKARPQIKSVKLILPNEQNKSTKKDKLVELRDDRLPAII